MPSAYTLACDKIQQAHAILDSEIWRDDKVSHLMESLIAQLHELDQKMIENDKAAQDVEIFDTWQNITANSLRSTANNPKLVNPSFSGQNRRGKGLDFRL